MIYELRVYRTLPGQMPRLLERFRDHTVGIWERLGIRPVGFWVTEVGEVQGNELTYLLAWESMAEREQRWGAFQADAQWKQAKADSEKPGFLVANIASKFVVPTSFSALQ